MMRDRTTDKTYISEYSTHTKEESAKSSQLELIRATCTREQYSSAICDALKSICFVPSSQNFVSREKQPKISSDK